MASSIEISSDDSRRKPVEPAPQFVAADDFQKLGHRRAPRRGRPPLARSMLPVSAIQQP